MEEFYIDCDGIRLHSKLDKPQGKDKCPLCILIHGFTGHMEEPHIIAAQKAMNDAGVAVLRVENLMKVVFPAPFNPTTDKCSPEVIFKLMSFNTYCSERGYLKLT